MKVRDVKHLHEGDGWRLVATRGSRRQFKYLTKSGRVTIAGNRPTKRNPERLPAFEASGTVRSILTRYAIVIEKAENNYSAYVPDLPGCVVTGDSVGAVEREMQHAIRFHLEGMREDGVPPPPEPTSVVDDVEG